MSTQKLIEEKTAPGEVLCAEVAPGSLGLRLSSCPESGWPFSLSHLCHPPLNEVNGPSKCCLKEGRAHKRGAQAQFKLPTCFEWPTSYFFNTEISCRITNFWLLLKNQKIWQHWPCILVIATIIRRERFSGSLISDLILYYLSHSTSFG